MKLKGQRAASDIQRELSLILLTETKDEDLEGVTITYVEVTNDLSFAKIYFTTLDDTHNTKTENDLNNASGFFRTMLADKLDIRHIPELRFIYDESIEHAKKIESIIKEIHQSED